MQRQSEQRADQLPFFPLGWQLFNANFSSSLRQGNHSEKLLENWLRGIFGSYPRAFPQQFKLAQRVSNFSLGIS
jgi:hypothetical protein